MVTRVANYISESRWYLLQVSVTNKWERFSNKKTFSLLFFTQISIDIIWKYLQRPLNAGTLTHKLRVWTMFFHLLAHKYKPCSLYGNLIFLQERLDFNWFRQISKQNKLTVYMVCLRYNFCETKDTVVLHPHDKRTILSKLYNTLLRLLSTKYVQNFQKFVFSLLT